MARVVRQIRIDRSRSFRVVLDTNHTDPYVNALLQQSYWLRDEWDLASRFLPGSGGRFLDLGGHMGSFSLTAAAHGHEVIVVEASPTNASLIRASAEANGFTNFHVVNAAIYRERKQLYFYENGPYGFLVEYDHANCVPVAALPVRDILEERGWNHVDVVKMDIEGSEIWGLDGMEATLSRPDAPAIYFESNGFTLHDFGGAGVQELRAKLESLGYAIFEYGGGQAPLRPTTAAMPQPHPVINCLAAKLAANPIVPGGNLHRGLVNLGRKLRGRKAVNGWLRGRAVGAPATEHDLIAEFHAAIMAAADRPQREHIRRELARSSATIRNDLRIREFLSQPEADLASAA